MHKLPQNWENILNKQLINPHYYDKLNRFLDRFYEITPDRTQLFHVFYKIPPEKVRLIIIGEDPYPRKESANGIAFWDLAFSDWESKSTNNSLKNICKALLIEAYNLPPNLSFNSARHFIQSHDFFENPEALFESWISRGVLLLNRSLSYSRFEDKSLHFEFWKEFIESLLRYFASQPCALVLWGKKAESLKPEQIGFSKEKIIRQGHPAYLHHFIIRKKRIIKPFREIQDISGVNLNWC